MGHTEKRSRPSCCKESTIGILDKLVTNSVTPVGLPFILDDMLGM
ncbi:DUF6514 family protein [Anaerobacterium chartisolvens]